MKIPLPRKSVDKTGLIIVNLRCVALCVCSTWLTEVSACASVMGGLGLALILELDAIYRSLDLHSHYTETRDKQDEHWDEDADLLQGIQGEYAGSVLWFASCSLEMFVQFFRAPAPTPHTSFSKQTTQFPLGNAQICRCFLCESVPVDVTWRTKFGLW